ncbi:hypothetical protein KZP23_05040 [Echinicola marina]|uniref:hypothetical protein n=1 Tax=Echinicola marina TaxID=2859768 RepID=UPI001CF64E54|nr:hypothetical protein [Echinicola marina]UCS94394.1 hypothetical protein KZP23_05040 [Echinicola marina]
MKIIFINTLLFIITCTSIFSCTTEVIQQHQTIEVIGAAEVNFDATKACLNINYNGSKEGQESLEKLMSGKQMENFQVKKINESYYKSNNTKGVDFEYGISYRLILNKATDRDLISSLLRENNIGANLSSGGYFINIAEIQSKNELGFNQAIENAKSRIEKHASAMEKNYEILSIEEIDDFQQLPIDGIIYNTSLIKKVKVKALLN